MQLIAYAGDDYAPADIAPVTNWQHATKKQLQRLQLICGASPEIEAMQIWLLNRQPMDDVFGWNELPRRVRVDGSGEDGQTFLDPGTCEPPCLSLCREGHGLTRASGSG